MVHDDTQRALEAFRWAASCEASKRAENRQAIAMRLARGEIPQLAEPSVPRPAPLEARKHRRAAVTTRWLAVGSLAAAAMLLLWIATLWPMSTRLRGGLQGEEQGAADVMAEPDKNEATLKTPAPGAADRDEQPVDVSVVLPSKPPMDESETVQAGDGQRSNGVVPSRTPSRAAVGARTRQMPARDRQSSSLTDPVVQRDKSTDLEREVELIGRARQKLAAGHNRDALAVLRDHALDHPQGALNHERWTLMVQATCQLRGESAAKVVARQFAAEAPNSTVARDLAANPCSPQKKHDGSASGRAPAN